MADDLLDKDVTDFDQENELDTLNLDVNSSEVKSILDEFSTTEFSTDNLFDEKNITNDEHKRIVKQFSEEIIRKQNIIDGIKEHNELLLGTTVKQAEKITELREKIKKLHREKMDQFSHK